MSLAPAALRPWRAAALLGCLLGCLLAFGAATPAAVQPSADPGPLPGESLYQLGVTLQTSTGVALPLAELRGKPLLIAMFYASCSSVCPLLTATMQRIERALAEPERRRLRFVMVSLDPAHDTPEHLTAFAAEHHVDTGHWILARTDSAQVRALAAALDVRYRMLPDGSFSHASVITLLDADGVPRARTRSLDGADPEFAAALHAVLEAAAPADTVTR